MSLIEPINNPVSFLTVGEVSSLLRLSALTIYKYIKEGRISVVEFGGHYRISNTSLNNFIDSHTCVITKEGK